MTTDQNIFDLTLLVLAFFLTTMLLFILYSRSLDQLKASLQENISQYKAYEDLHKNYQVSLEKYKHLALDYAKSEANGKSLNALLEQAGEQRKQLRKDFIEQSEIAVEWRQKHDKLKESFDSQKDYMKRTAASWNKLSNEVAQLEAELDRGNEMISWLKADLDKLYRLLFVNENNIMELLANGKFPDEKGIYRKNYISKNGDSLPLGQYIDSLHDSLISQLELSGKHNSVEKIQELDHLFKNPFREKKPKGWNLKVYPRDEKGRAMKPMPKEGIMENEFEKL